MNYSYWPANFRTSVPPYSNLPTRQGKLGRGHLSQDDQSIHCPLPPFPQVILFRVPASTTTLTTGTHYLRFCYIPEIFDHYFCVCPLQQEVQTAPGAESHRYHTFGLASDTVSRRTCSEAVPSALNLDTFFLHCSTAAEPTTPTRETLDHAP